jgi:hypothetical protein
MGCRLLSLRASRIDLVNFIIKAALIGLCNSSIMETRVLHVKYSVLMMILSCGQLLAGNRYANTPYPVRKQVSDHVDSG